METTTFIFMVMAAIVVVGLVWSGKYNGEDNG